MYHTATRLSRLAVSKLQALVQTKAAVKQQTERMLNLRMRSPQEDILK
jgi:hypothetical protein